MLSKKIKNICLVILMLSFIGILSAAWLENVPATIEQPDGTLVDVFYSGDEFHNWIHDIDNYTIVFDEETGFYSWATYDGDTIVSSDIPIHLGTPQSIGLKPNINITEEQYREKRQRRETTSSRSRSAAPTTGTINNIVIFIRFAGEAEFSVTTATYESLFNNASGSVLSLKKYFIDASYQQLTVNSHFFPTPTGNTILSYQSQHPRGYFRPFSSTNLIGYTNDTESRLRSHDLLAAAINFIEPQVPTSLILDSNNNGNVDNVCFVISGNASHNSDLLWPHKWSLHSQHVSIHGKRVWEYNVNLQNMMNVAVLAHEFAHTLGAPDLYRYYNSNITPIGPWCLMASTNTNQPQSICSYLKAKYLNWTYLPAIFVNGTYTLNPLTTHQTDHALRIISPNSNIQHFIVEYRRHNTGLIDQSLTNSGILIYRVNTTVDGGNMEAPDEVYLFRQSGTVSNNGQINNALFSANLGRTTFNDSTNPSSFLSNGGPGGISITNIGNAGETITFTLTLPNGDMEPFPGALEVRLVENEPVLLWTQSPGATGYIVYRDFFPIANVGSVTTYRDATVVSGNTYAYTVTALYGANESESTNIFTITIPVIVSDDDIVKVRPEAFLSQNYPNPFNPTTEIAFEIPVIENISSNYVNISVYNIRGQKIKTLLDGIYPSGQHSISWNGTDDIGNSVGSGVYFYRLSMGEIVETRKMIMIK
jgi:M6 family metalloprotease-like protein